MRIGFVNPGKLGTFQPPLGLAYLAAYIQKYDDGKHEIKVIDENAGDDVETELLKFKPDVVGITSTTHQILRAYDVANFINIEFNIPTIIGGPHVSALPERTMRESKFNIAVVGEGELTFFELIQNLKEGGLKPNILKNIKGICFKSNSKIIKTKPRAFIDNLDSIPFPARDLLNMEYYLNCKEIVGGYYKKSVSIMSSRGCPYNCTFCSGMIKERFRAHSAEYVIKEIEHLIDRYKVKAVLFFDDLFIVDRKRVKKICQYMIERGISEKIVWNVQIRANLISEKDVEFLRLMRNAGCVEATFGFETGSPRMLSFLKKNSVTIKHNHQAIEVCKKADIKVFGNFMIGTIGETVGDIEMTKNFILEHNKDLTDVAIHLTTPYPGSELWGIYEKRGLLKDLKWEDYIMDNFESFKSPKCFSDIISGDKLLAIHRELLSLSIEKYPLNAKIEKVIRNPVKFFTFVLPYMLYKIKKTVSMIK